MNNESTVKPEYPANLIGAVLLRGGVTVTPAAASGLEKALETLRPDEKTAILKRFKEGKKYEVLAAEMNLPRLTARRQVENGLRKLRRHENRCLFSDI